MSDAQSETSIFLSRARDNGKNTRALQSLSLRDLRFGMHFMMSSGNFSMLVPLRLSECTLFPVHFPNSHTEFPTETQTQTKPTQHFCDDHCIT